MDKTQIKKGTTTVAVVVKDAVVIAADKRAALGYLIANKTVDKIFEITNKIAMTIAGSAADGQMLAKLLKAEMSLYEMNTGIAPSLSVAANLMSNLLFGPGKSYVPYMVQLIIAGVDDNEEFALYTLDPSGSLIREKRYYSTGSGSPVAFGVLEAKYDESGSQKDAVSLVVQAIRAAISRDMPTGEGIDVMVITKNGTQRLKPEQIIAK